MQKILEINPLKCPRCKAEMRILAFLDDPNEISKIIKSLNEFDGTNQTFEDFN